MGGSTSLARSSMASKGRKVVGLDCVERDVTESGTRHHDDIQAGPDDLTLVVPEDFSHEALGAVSLDGPT